MTEIKAPRPKTNDVAAIILAAGRSERMGAFKPLLPFGGSTVIDTCIENLRSGGVETVVVVIGQGPRAEDLKQHLKDAPISVAVNPNPVSEMTDSIASGVRQLADETKAVLILPADHPAVPSKVVSVLISEWTKGAPLVVPTFNGGGGHPVLVDLSFRAQLLNLDPERGLKTLFHAHVDQVTRVAVDSNFIARDMDSWDDYHALHEEVFGVSPPERATGEFK